MMKVRKYVCVIHSRRIYEFFEIRRLIDESVRWLLINGRTEEAERILRKAARWNGKKFTNIEDVYKEAHHLQSTENGREDICMTAVTDSEVNKADSEDVSKLHVSSDNYNIDSEVNTTEVNTAGSEDNSKLHATCEKYNIIDILKNPELRIDTFILWYAW